MKLFLCLCVLVLPSFCLLKETDGQHDDDLSTNFVFPKDRKGRPTTRIIGGVEVTPHSYPFQVALNVHYPEATYFCGGSLISPQWVLTAAHCVENNPMSAVIEVGAHNISADESTTAVILTSTKFIVHENWNKGKLQNDVALIKLPRNVTINQYVKTVRLASGDKTYANEIGTIVGWGDVGLKEISMVLRQVSTTILTNEECAAADDLFSKTIIPTHICASGLGIVGSCSGDSGGPLLVDGVQVGIVSFGTTICTLGKPSVFTRVSAFHDWIVTHAVDGATSYSNIPYSFAVLVAAFLVRLLDWI